MSLEFFSRPARKKRPSSKDLPICREGAVVGWEAGIFFVSFRELWQVYSTNLSIGYMEDVKLFVGETETETSVEGRLRG